MSKAIVNKTLTDVFLELERARAENPPFNSAHEGWAILREEVDELWDIVKIKRIHRSKTEMRREAIQIAAMAIRFIEDICDDVP